MKYIISSFILSLLFFSLVSADNTDDGCLGSSFYNKYTANCYGKTDFELYQCRVTNLCNSCNDSSSKKIFKTTDYEKASYYQESSSNPFSDASTPFYDVQKIYKNNMNSIYKCALLDSQERSMDLIENIISSSDKTGIIKSLLQSKINTEKSKISLKKTNLNCGSLGGSSVTLDKTLMKKEILNQASFELCKYTYYLDYLKSYYNSSQNLLGISDEDMKNTDTTTSKFIGDVARLHNNMTTLINNENTNIYKVFPLAFYAYSEYEENYPMHLMLVLIKEDYTVTRDLLAKVLGPINQVVYKIKDAMKNY